MAYFCCMIDLVQKFYNRYRNLILYCIIGCAGASLDFCLFTCLTIYGHLHYQIANIISISSGIILNFFLNYYFNFKIKNKLLLRLLSFYLVGLLGLGFSCAILWLFVNCCNLNVILAKIGTIFFVTILQYTLNKLISFRKTEND